MPCRSAPGLRRKVAGQHQSNRSQGWVKTSLGITAPGVALWCATGGGKVLCCVWLAGRSEA